MSMEDLKSKFPWTETMPDVPRNYTKGRPTGWCAGENVAMFKTLANAETKVIIDGGSWMGLSAWHWLNMAPNATVICIDTWQGSAEHQAPEMRETLRTLYETFLVNMADFKDRLIPVRKHSINGMRNVLDAGISPDIVYVDWSHDEKNVFNDTATALKYFPDAQICGDDFTWQGVRDALERLRISKGVKYSATRTCWKMERQPVEVPPDWADFASGWQGRECNGAEKYLHWFSQAERRIALMNSCGLGAVSGLDVLDISAGCGSWAYYLQKQGHRVTLTETTGGETALYADALQTLGLPKSIPFTYDQYRFKRLPAEIGIFDVVSAISVIPMSFWSEEECRSFIADAMEHVRPGGFLLVAPNATDCIPFSKAVDPSCKFRVNSQEYFKIQKGHHG